ncbi:aldo/keto reductase [Amycolatopsis rhizosphaerae]|uniref:Aldo/keto reductase n=1 Tax=Amycolatopsis rhizosphaerae TaxID=2053003 RepID=A0A558DDM2_9PSEU|nr:aldo/keto reductase [Amycolatopsis rhizosphaerae]TVT59110.1 aldo/keto reductase [Amycolatopsis rhizosphaerae]
MKQAQLGTGLRVGMIGLGCAGMSGAYGRAQDERSIATIRSALDAGITLIDTADHYGMGHNESLIGRALRTVDRGRAVVSVKFGALFGVDGSMRGVNGRPDSVANFLAYSLQRLGTDHVDIYRPARLDPTVPIEDTVGAIAEMVGKGYVRGIGLSEVSAATLRRAHAVHPITDVQIEYSLFSRGIEDSILPTCRELGIGVTAYGVLGQGLLSGAYRPSPTDNAQTRGHLPRFAPGNVEINLGLVERLRTVAAVRGITVAQLAIAWVLAQGAEHHDIVATIGASHPERIVEAVGALERALSDDDLSAIEQAVPNAEVAGARYAAPLLALLDSER